MAPRPSHSPFAFQKIEATDVTADELTGIITQVTQAVQRGDDTLTGDAGTAVTTLIGTNAKAAPNADQTAVDAGTATATAAAQTATSVATGTTTGGSVSTGTSAGGSSSGSSDTSSSSGASTGGSDGGSSSSGSQTTTIHHDAVYTTVHHDAVYTTEHHDATYTTVHHDAVTEEKIVENYTGQVFDSMADYEAYAYAQLDAGNTKVSYSLKQVVVQAAYDEQVLETPASDEQVLVSAAWDEQVLVSPAWDETK